MKNHGRIPSRTGSFELNRLAVCEEAARIMDQQGIRDFQVAKTKAVERLGLGRRFPLPSNREIEQALKQRLRLFNAEVWTNRCRLLWRLATETMEMFSSYNPRVVGPLLRGIVTDKTPVELHLFADSPEEITDSFLEYAIPYECFDKRVRFRRNRYALIPAFRFACEDVSVELLAFARKDIREAPICPVDGQPMRRLSLPRAREMLALA